VPAIHGPDPTPADPRAVDAMNTAASRSRIGGRAIACRKFVAERADVHVHDVETRPRPK
jgi:hypothetical protein